MSSAVAPQLGPFHLLRTLGRGSMGVVHLAFDSQHQRHVALKTLALGDDLARAEFIEVRQRFLAEAATAQRLSHPNIVSVFGAGEDNGVAWLAMEVLPGCELGRYTAAQRLLPEHVVLQVVEPVARALAHAHALGVVHRDVKPGNVMLDLPRLGVKLTDFGVAGLADHSRTRTGVVLGTPVYMAPEQLAGAAADARSDQYSLGVLMFHLLTGRLPHEHASLGELLRQVAREAAPDVRTLRPGLTPGLAAVVAKALHKQPAARHAGCAALADEIAALLSLQPEATSCPVNDRPAVTCGEG